MKDPFCRPLELDLPSGAINLDLPDLDGRDFEFDVLGGLTRRLKIRNQSVATLARLNFEAAD